MRVNVPAPRRPQTRRKPFSGRLHPALVTSHHSSSLTLTQDSAIVLAARVGTWEGCVEASPSASLAYADESDSLGVGAVASVRCPSESGACGTPEGRRELGRAASFEVASGIGGGASTVACNDSRRSAIRRENNSKKSRMTVGNFDAIVYVIAEMSEG